MHENDIRALQSGLRGDLLLEGDEGYHDVRKIHNAMIDRRPLGNATLSARMKMKKCFGGCEVEAAISGSLRHLNFSCTR